MITPELKDKILADVITRSTKSGKMMASYSDDTPMFGISGEMVRLVLKQFEEYGLVKLHSSMHDVTAMLKIEALDFQRNGGFQLAEQIKIAELDKLYYELEKLQKEDPNGKWGKRAGLIMTAISTIVSILGYQNQ